MECGVVLLFRMIWCYYRPCFIALPIGYLTFANRKSLKTIFLIFPWYIPDAKMVCMWVNMCLTICCKIIYCIVLGKHPWALAAQAPNFEVAGYTETVLKWFNYPRTRGNYTEIVLKWFNYPRTRGNYTEIVLKWFNYPCARAHPGCDVSCQGTESTCIIGSLCFVVLRWGQPDSGEGCIVLQSRPTRSLVAKFPHIQSLLAVREFRAAGDECCERGHRRVYANFWCLKILVIIYSGALRHDYCT